MADHSKQIRAENHALHTASKATPDAEALLREVVALSDEGAERLLNAIQDGQYGEPVNATEHDEEPDVSGQSGTDGWGDAQHTPAEGSYHFYRKYSGSFVNAMLDAIALADRSNKERIRLAFPQLTAAFDLWYNNNDRDGNCAPDGFPPDPFAVAE